MKRAMRIAELLDDLLAGQGLSAVSKMVRLHSAWPEVAGPLVSGKTSPSRLKNGVLAVLVRNHAWAQELQLKKPLLIERINAVLGPGAVKDIRFGVGPLPADESVEEETSPPRREHPRAFTEPEGISGVADEETRRILLSIARSIASLKR